MRRGTTAVSVSSGRARNMSVVAVSGVRCGSLRKFLPRGRARGGTGTTGSRSADRTSATSARNAPASTGRPAGSLSVAATTSSSISYGMSLTRDDGAGTRLWTCWYATFIADSPLKGGLPVSSSNSTTPVA
jgi:hypothetical protein